MSERPNDQPDGPADDPAGAPEPEAVDIVDAEANADLEGAPEADVVADLGEADAVDDQEAGGEDGGEAAEDGVTIEDDEPTVEEGDAELQASEAPVAGAAAGAASGPAAAVTRPMRPSERRALRGAMEHAQLTIDPALRIKDRASALFVLVTVGVFVLIMLNGVVLGRGGLLTPLPTLPPIPTAAPSASPAPSASAAPSATAAPTTSGGPSLSPAPS